MKRVLAAVLLACALPARAADRTLEAGLEDFAYRTGPTRLDPAGLLGLDRYEDVLRATAGWKETRGPVRLVLRGFAQRSFGAQPRTRVVAREAYAHWSPSTALSVRAGKQRIAWGSGFAWNPTNRLEPAKNPLNTGLEQEGTLAVRADWIPTAWAGVVGVLARGTTAGGDLPFALPDARRPQGGAIRARFLVHDTDLAVVLSGGRRLRTLAGLDVARTLGAVAVHAEGALYRGAELQPARDGRTFLRLASGLLYTHDEASASLEYFFNQEGYTDAERDAYLQGIGGAAAAAADPRRPVDARRVAGAQYAALVLVPYAGGLGLRRHYLHAALSRTVGGGRWTLAARGVLGLSDGGAALTPGVTFAPRGDLTIALDGVILLGPADSEYGLSPVRDALQARVKVLF